VLPFLLDFLTVFFIVAGCALLWLNFRPKRPIVVITADTQSPSSERPPSHSHPLFVEIERNLAEARPMKVLSARHDPTTWSSSGRRRRGNDAV